MNNEQLKFKTIMAYFKPIGSVGFNVDMDRYNVDYFDDLAYTSKGKPIKILGSIADYIQDLINKNGNELYQLTNKQDYTYTVDVTINPKENKIYLTPKYWELDYDTTKFEFNWKKDFRGTEIEKIYNIFESDEDIAYIIVDWVARYGYFQILEITLDTGSRQRVLHMDEKSRFNFFLKQIISKTIENEIWTEEEGSEGTLVFRRWDTGKLSINIYNKTLEIGQQIIIDDEYFRK